MPEASGRVLLVEDFRELSSVSAKILRRAGLVVSVVESAEAALELLERERPDVIVTDISLPGMSGLELVRKIRSAYPEVGILLVSGSPEPQAAIGPEEQSAFLAKPYRGEDLVARVKELMKSA